MDWKLFASTFGVIFLAELGDKTQLATFTAAAAGSGGGSGAGLSVFVGSALALVASSAIAVVAGSLVGDVIPAKWLARAGGAAFIALGAWMLWKSLSGPSA